MIIYKATNKNNGKSYIGQTIKDLEIRKRQHLNERNPRKFQYILQDDPYSFNWEIICECDKDELDEKEDYYIEKYNSLHPHGYNLITNRCKKHLIKNKKEESVKLAEYNYILEENREAWSRWEDQCEKNKKLNSRIYDLEIHQEFLQNQLSIVRDKLEMRYVNQKQAAKILGIKLSTLKFKMNSGKIKYDVIDGEMLFRLHHLYLRNGYPKNHIKNIYLKENFDLERKRI